MNYVVGSGPAGIAAAAALLDRGLPVTVLDAGGELEADLRAKAQALNRLPQERWDPRDVDALRGPLRYNAEGTPLKLHFGSDYPYRDVDRYLPISADGVDAYRALATGGLSTLWGASILPYTAADLEGWPITAEDLVPHYTAVLGLTGLSAARDGLERFYPLFTEPDGMLGVSRQAEKLLERLERHAAKLEDRRIYFGRARLAIPNPDRCVRCGLCLYGCPFDLIYSSHTTLRELQAGPGEFHYVPGYIVRRIRERRDAVEIHAEPRGGDAPRVFEASRVYLAAGAFASTAILLDSLGTPGRTVTFRQSEHFLLPLLLPGRVGPVARERLHTLSQVFIEVLDPSVARHTVHLQVYTYNDLMQRMLRHRLGPVFPLVAPLVRLLLRWVVVAKGYLHSDESSAIRARLAPMEPSGTGLRLEATINPEARRTVRSVHRLLWRNARRLGVVPVSPGLRVGLPGSGVHVGGSFPMRHQPTEFETDVLGRPGGLHRVHVVDSTVFPTVPAPTITLTAMANAHRIATRSPE